MASCRKCSHCGGYGHNSRTCADRGIVRLFGVRISGVHASSSLAATMRKSASAGNLVETTTTSSASCAVRQDGYASDDLILNSSHSRERKKGVPWTEEEHKLFLVALQKLGKGDWRGISRHFVKTRTPTQVASHAQKYFLRQSNLSSRRRRRSSLFDMTADVVGGYAVEEETAPEQLIERASITEGLLDTNNLHGKISPKIGHVDVGLASKEVDAMESEKSSLQPCIPINGRTHPSAFSAFEPHVSHRDAGGLQQAAVLMVGYPWAGLQWPCPSASFQFPVSKVVKPTPIPPRLDPSAPGSMDLNVHPIVGGPRAMTFELCENMSRRSAFHPLSLPLVGGVELSKQGSSGDVISVA